MIRHLLELQDISKYYSNGNTATLGVSKINLNLDIGEFVVVTGESGSGKSTLLNIVSGLDNYDDGEFFVCGRETSGFNIEDYEQYRKEYIGNVFQDYKLINSYTVYQNIEIAMMLSGKKKIKEHINDLIRKVGLEEFANVKVSKLSGGQKQRVAIARALAKDATIIVADEPTGNLDMKSAEEVLKILHEVSKDRLIILVTHNFEHVKKFATRKLLMKDGRIVEDIILRNTFSIIENRNIENSSSTRLDSSNTKLSCLNEIRLGIRNAVNIPTKFLLLLFVFVFLISSLFALLSSTRDRENQLSLMGNSSYYINKSDERLILKKNDGTAFNKKDIKKVKNTANIEQVVESDIVLDKLVNLVFNNEYVFGEIHQIGEISEKLLAAGRLPKSAYEIVIEINPNSGTYYSIAKENINNYIGKKSYVLSDESGEKLISRKVKVVGVVVSKDAGEYQEKLYFTDELNKKILITEMSKVCNVTVLFGERQVSYKNMAQLFSSDYVSKGKAYVLDNCIDLYYSGSTNKALQDDLTIKASCNFFRSKIKLNIEKIINRKDVLASLGISKREYDNLSDAIFISQKDYKKIFDRGYYQISAIMKNAKNAKSTIEKLENSGLIVLRVKDTLSDVTGGNNEMMKILASLTLYVSFAAVIIVAYYAIKLIIKSRNMFYLILRMFCATKSNIRKIILFELIFISLLAWSILLAVMLLTNINNSSISALTNIISFITFKDIVVIFFISIILSIVLSLRYASNLFKNNTISIHREVVR